jgi:hypothetical protein
MSFEGTFDLAEKYKKNYPQIMRCIGINTEFLLNLTQK